VLGGHTEGKCNWSYSRACKLSQGTGDNITTEDEEDREDIAGVLPLGPKGVGRLSRVELASDQFNEDRRHGMKINGLGAQCGCKELRRVADPFWPHTCDDDRGLTVPVA
jgi:hypothetical protein